MAAMSSATSASLCKHSSFSLPQALLYCFTLASFFVTSLYLFVPSTVRKLPRDHTKHIKWRSFIVTVVSAMGIAVYPWLFCDNNDLLIEEEKKNLWYSYVGITAASFQVKVVLHATILYFGSFACSWMNYYHHARIMQLNEERRSKLPLLPKPRYIIISFSRLWIKPTQESLQSFFKDETYRWTILRNLLIAPISEECVFRACIIAPLLSSHNMDTTTTSNSDGHISLSPTQVCWIAPLFFGVAHLHHFYEQYRRLPILQRTKETILKLTLGLLFQFSYTTLFGAYASHVFIRSGSLLSVILVHMFCNYTGLPEIDFVSPTSGLHCYRWLLLVAYIIGIVIFIKGFDSSFLGLFPLESVLATIAVES